MNKKCVANLRNVHSPMQLRNESNCSMKHSLFSLPYILRVRCCTRVESARDLKIGYRFCITQWKNCLHGALSNLEPVVSRLSCFCDFWVTLY